MKAYGLFLLTALLQWTSALEAEITQIVRVKNKPFTCLFTIHYEGDTCFGDSTVTCSPNDKRKVARNVELVLEDGTVINIEKLKIGRKRNKMIGCKATSKSKPMITESTTGLTNRTFRCTFDDNKQLGGNARSPVNPHSAKNWASGKIPYYFTASVTSNDRKVYRRAMKQIHDKTCFRFEERNGKPSEHHLEIRTSGSHSCIGGFSAGVWAASSTRVILQSDRQLADDSRCNWEGGVLHELMHVLGVMHTQKRKDRDDYIIVYQKNISLQSQYSICHNCWISTEYDCSSIMHYGTKTFTINMGVDTMRAKDPSNCKLTRWGPNVASTTDWELLNIIGNKLCSGATYRVSGINTKKVTASIGSTLWTDRPQYIVTKMPEELIGSTLFQPKVYVDISTIEVFSSHKARIFVGVYEGRDGGLMDVLSKQGWRLEDGWFVEWNRGEGERLHKIWSTKINAGQTITFTTTKNAMTFDIFISEATYRVSGINTKKVIASIGSTLWTDRPQYIVTKMPEELIGSTLFQPKVYVDISTIEVFSSHKARIFVGVYEGRDGSLMDVLPKQGWRLEDGWFVEWNHGEKERLHKIWSTKIDAGQTITFTTTKNGMTFDIFISEDSGWDNTDAYIDCQTRNDPHCTSGVWEIGSGCGYTDAYTDCPAWKDPYCTLPEFVDWMMENCAKTCKC